MSNESVSSIEPSIFSMMARQLEDNKVKVNKNLDTFIEEREFKINKLLKEKIRRKKKEGSL